MAQYGSPFAAKQQSPGFAGSAITGRVQTRSAATGGFRPDPRERHAAERSADTAVGAHIRFRPTVKRSEKRQEPRVYPAQHDHRVFVAQTQAMRRMPLSQHLAHGWLR
jgi:hypothetical protein